MSHFWQAFWGRWAGGISVALFIAVLTVLGMGPETWAAYLSSGLPEWVTPFRAQMALLGLAALAFLHMFVAPIVRPFLGRGKARDMEAYDVIDWLTEESVWGWFSYLRWNSFGFVRDFAYDEFGNQARDGNIEVRGYLNVNYPIEVLPRDYWQGARLDRDDMGAKRTPGGRTVIDNKPSRLLPFGGLLIERQQVLKTWPRAPKWIRPFIKLIVATKHLGDRYRRWRAGNT